MTGKMKALRLQEMTATGTPQVLTFDEAADLLNVHRTYLLVLIDKEEIPATGKPGQRRLRRDDILPYKLKRDAERHAALRELTELSEDAGLYDADYRSITDPT